MGYEQHGDTGTRLYRIWKSMKCRCLNINHPSYKNYGARGISICDEWKNSYLCFKNWAINHGYDENLELDRINVNGNYCSENCRWITHHLQTLNRRDTLYAVIDGKKYKLRDFCKAHGVSINSVNGWRHLGILEEKLQSRLNISNLKIIGGKK